MGERGGQDRERSTSRDSNSGRLKHNDAILYVSVLTTWLSAPTRDGF